jgi:hypothetical protein
MVRCTTLELVVLVAKVEVIVCWTQLQIAQPNFSNEVGKLTLEHIFLILLIGSKYSRILETNLATKYV